MKFDEFWYIGYEMEKLTLIGEMPGWITSITGDTYSCKITKIGDLITYTAECFVILRIIGQELKEVGSSNFENSSEFFRANIIASRKSCKKGLCTKAVALFEGEESAWMFGFGVEYNLNRSILNEKYGLVILNIFKTDVGLGGIFDFVDERNSLFNNLFREI